MNTQLNTQALVDLGGGHLPSVPANPPRNETEYQLQVADLTYLVGHAATGRQSIVDAFAVAISARQNGYRHNEAGAAA